MSAILFSYSLPLLFFLAFVVCYFTAAFFLSVIPLNHSYKKSNSGIKIMVISDGVHADFVVPAIDSVKNWWEVLAPCDFESPIEKMSYLAFGWGDRGFYLDTPTWADLTLKTAVVAVLMPSPTVVHVTAYEEEPKKKFSETLFLNENQYARLCQYIERAFTKTDSGKVIFIPDVGYTPTDNFYQAEGYYHCFNTCNAWVNRGLSETGIKSAVWSPLVKGIFYQLARI